MTSRRATTGECRRHHESDRSRPQPGRRGAADRAGGLARHLRGRAARDAQGRVRNAPARRSTTCRRGDFGLKDERGQPLAPAATPESLPAAPASVYASTKLMQEYICTQCAAGTDLEVAVLRLQNVYGPGQSLRNPYTGVISISASRWKGANGSRFSRTARSSATSSMLTTWSTLRCLCADRARAGVAHQYRQRRADLNSRHGAIGAEALRGSPDDHRVSGNFRAGDVRHAVAE